MGSIKNVKDVGLDPIPEYLPSSSTWHSEFERLQREIIEHWHSCNVSLAHRTYFFLLFSGDQKDSIYMEVELRRLSFIKDAFSRGSRTVDDGRILTPTTRYYDQILDRILKDLYFVSMIYTSLYLLGHIFNIYTFL